MMNYRIVFVLKCTLYVLELGLYLYQFPESDGDGAALEQKTRWLPAVFLRLAGRVVGPCERDRWMTVNGTDGVTAGSSHGD